MPKAARGKFARLPAGTALAPYVGSHPATSRTERDSERNVTYLVTNVNRTATKPRVSQSQRPVLPHFKKAKITEKATGLVVLSFPRIETLAVCEIAGIHIPKPVIRHDRYARRRAYGGYSAHSGSN